MPQEQYDFLMQAKEAGHLTPEQEQEVELYRRKRAYETLKTARDAGQLTPEQSQLLDNIPADKFESGRSGIGSALRGAAQELTLGYGDEIAGAVEGALTGQTIPQSITQHRASDTLAEEANPGAYLGGQIAGGVGSALVPGSAALRIGGSLAKRMAASAATGAGVEGTRATGHAQGGLAERLAASPVGLAMGGTMGLFAPVVGDAVGKTAKKIMARARNKPIPGVSGRAADELLEIAARDAATTGRPLSAAPGRLQGMGDEAMAADLGDEFRTAAGAAANIAGPTAPALARTVAARAEGAPQRIVGSLDETLGSPKLAGYAREEISNVKRGLGDEYDLVLDQAGPLDVGDLVDTLDNAARRAGPEVNALLGRYSAALKRAGPEVSPEALHNIRHEFSGEINRLSQQGKSVPAAMLTKHVDDFNNVLDEVPGYAAVRAKYAEQSELGDAVEAGATALRGGQERLTPVGIAQIHAGRTPDQRELFKYGLREALDRSSGTKAGGAASLSKVLGQPWNRALIEQTTEGRAGKTLYNRLETEAEYGATAKAILNAAKNASRSDYAQRFAPRPSRLSTPLVMGAGLVNRLIDAAGRSPRRRSLNETAGRFDERPAFTVGRLQPGHAQNVASAVGGRRDVAPQIANFMARQGQSRDEGIQALLNRLNAQERATLEAALARQMAGTGTAMLAPTMHVQSQ